MNPYESGAVIDMSVGHNSATPAPIGADALRVAAQAALTALENLHEIDTETECITIDVRDEIEALRAAIASTAQLPITYAPPSPTLGVAPSGPGTGAAHAAAPKAAPARWYMVNKFDMATLCADKQDAEQAAADAQAAWPYVGPHRAVQMVEVAAAPAPAAQGDSLDAARYRWLAAHCRSTAEHWGGRWSIVVEGPAPKSHDSEDDFDAAIDAAIDAARAAKAGGAT